MMLRAVFNNGASGDVGRMVCIVVEPITINYFKEASDFGHQHR